MDCCSSAALSTDYAVAASPMLPTIFPAESTFHLWLQYNNSWMDIIADRVRRGASPLIYLKRNPFMRSFFH